MQLKRNSKNIKIVCDQVALPKTGLFAVQIFGPLGVNFKDQNSFHKHYYKA